MKVIDRLAADADQKDKAAASYEKDFVKITEFRGTRLYKQGFKAARARAAQVFADAFHNPAYQGRTYEDVFNAIAEEIRNLGEEEEKDSSSSK